MAKAAALEALHCLWAGLCDSLRLWPLPAGLSMTSPAFVRLVAHNSFFIASYVLFASYVVPFCHGDLAALPGGPGVVGSFLDMLFGTPNTVLFVAWLVPLYLYSLYANAVWHWQLTLEQGSPAAKKESSPVSEVTETVYRIVIYNAMLVLSYLSGFMPLVGPLLQATFYSWLYSVYCFEHRWTSDGLTLLRMIDYFEIRWVYFVGFGTPLTLLSYSQTSFFISYPLTSMAVPIFLATAMRAGQPPRQHYIPRLRMRELSEAAILRPLVRHMSSKRAKKREQNK